MDAAIVEVHRVEAHIARAEALAARHDTATLTRVQRLVRQLVLRALAAYRAGCRFPINRDFAERTPYFVDASGTRCAMAHLLELGGDVALVERIAGERNHAYVRELADEPQLLAWLRAAGLTVEEAAAIQPSYCSLVTECICGGDFSPIDYPLPARGVLEAVVQPGGMARVEVTYGDALGIAIGTDIVLANPQPVGARVLAPIDSAATTTFASITLDADGTYSCSSQGVSSAPALDPAAFAQAVTASDCVAALHAMDPDWSEEQDCDEPSAIGDSGCHAAGGESMSVGILLAVVAALVRRKL